jgi:uncharacterized protein with NRDE domain
VSEADGFAAVCLILLAWRVHPDYPLVLAANRDEFHQRPAAPAVWWSSPRILAGRDLSAGGTWLAVTPDGRFAALTNYRDPGRPRSDAPSRGALPVRLLEPQLPATLHLQQLQRIAGDYNGFNVLFSDGAQAAVFESVDGRGCLLEPGVYGLSNHLLDTPWPKVVTAKAALASALTQLPEEHTLLELLRDDRAADDRELPRTGLTLEWERLLSSAFVRTPTYGTRCSTILLIDRHGKARFTEWTWNADGALSSQVSYDWRCGETTVTTAAADRTR